MRLEVIDGPLVYRWPGGEVRMVPGHPVELPDDRAGRLLAKAPGRVREVRNASPHDPGEPLVWVQRIAPSARHDAKFPLNTPVQVPVSQAEELFRHYLGAFTWAEPPAPSAEVVVEPGLGRLAYWESNDGVIRRGRSAWLGMIEPGGSATFWVSVEEEGGGFAWVHESRLRSRRQYEAQQAAATSQSGCAWCGGPGPLRWRTGALLCAACWEGRR